MKDATMRIAMWSGPRNLSTALMYALPHGAIVLFGMSPFYAAYLKATGIDHPMSGEIIAAGETNPDAVTQICLGPIPQSQRLFYQKHMTLHMIPAFDRGFIRDLTNVFLIRHPARVIASYSRKRESPTLADIGFVQQAELFDQVADFMGHAPLVIDSADIRENPLSKLSSLCVALGIPFTERMLRWKAGPKPFDGVWAPHWYNAVHASTGIDEPEGPLPQLSVQDQALAEQALPYYEKLAAYRL